jgi:hypothetical protein
MVLLHKSFWDRAEGNADDYGNVWKPLNEVTIAIKRKMLGEEVGSLQQYAIPYYNRKIKGKGQGPVIEYEVVRQRYAQGRLEHRKYLPASQYEKYKKDISSSVSGGVNRTTAARRALASQQGDHYNDPAELINVRTGELAASLSPETVSRGRVYTNAGKTITWDESTGGMMTCVVDVAVVPYAEEVDKDRPIIPKNVERLEMDALRHAILKAQIIYDEIELIRGM